MKSKLFCIAVSCQLFDPFPLVTLTCKLNFHFSLKLIGFLKINVSDLYLPNILTFLPEAFFKSNCFYNQNVLNDVRRCAWCGLKIRSDYNQ